MRTHFRHPRVAGDVADNHRTVVQKAQAVAVHAQIAPVGVKNVLRFFRHMQSVEHFVHRIAAGFDEVREMGFHIVGIRVPVDFVGIILRCTHFVAKLEKFRDGFSRAGAVFFHFVDESVHAERHFAVIFLVGRNQVIGFGNAQPVDFVLHAEVAEQCADFARFLRRTKVVEFVQARFKFKSASFKAGGKTARQVVLFQK